MGLFYTPAASLEDTPAPTPADLAQGRITPDLGKRAEPDIRTAALDAPESSSPPSPPPRQELSVARLALAVGFVVLILIVGMVASHYEIEPWDSVLVATFQLLVGAVIGAVIGEKVGGESAGR